MEVVQSTFRKVKHLKNLKNLCIRIPRVHQSTAFPCPILNRTSGAKYSGVPHTELAPLLPLIPIFDKPKSVILIYPNSSKRTFSGFKLKLN